jgi:LysM repeat protein
MSRVAKTVSVITGAALSAASFLFPVFFPSIFSAASASTAVPARSARTTQDFPAIPAAPSYVSHTAKAVTTAKTAKAVKAPYTSVEVRSGDTLTKISEAAYGTAGDWGNVWDANKSEISDPDLIYPGQSLEIPADPQDYPAPSYSPPAPAPAPVQQAAPAAAPAAAASTDSSSSQGTSSSYGSSPVSYSGDSSFQQCVISHESGGNADIWNASGHWGLYQFSASTWAAYGGSPSDFGNASAAEQTQVFDNAMATAGGADNWSPYDGC